ncbi:Transposase [Streptococcus sp. DD10]|nr:Transposase [Streptococcus sp. DD10]
MSTNYSTTNQSYKHLSEVERGKIEAYLDDGLKPWEIARRLGINRSTITREISRGSVKQVKQINNQKAYYQHYYADAAQNRYRQARKASYYLKLDHISDDFLAEFTEAMKEKPRVHSVDTFVHTYKLQHVNEIVPSTKKHLGKSIEERPEEINNRSRFGDWEFDSVLGERPSENLLF